MAVAHRSGHGLQIRAIGMTNAIDNLPLTDQLARKSIPNNPNANVENLKDLLDIKFDQIFKLIK